MKRGLAIITFIILLTFCVTAAPTVTLSSPSNGATETSSTVSFTCSATDAALTSLALYTDTGGSWAEIASNTTSGTEIYFTHEITSISDGSYNWDCLATNDLSEIAWYTGNYTLTVTTVAVSFTGTITNQTITEDINSSNAFDLDTYFTGATSYSVEGNSQIDVTIAEDNQVSFGPTANFSGSETIRFSGTDGADTVYSNYITLNVTAVNDAPYQSSNMTDQSLTLNTNSTLTLSDYFTDVDGDTLNYTASSTSYVTINISGATATLSPQTDWSGNETVAFTASDGTLSVTANTITLTVAGATSNNAPTIDTYSPDSDPTLDPGASQDFSVTYSDSDNDTLTVTWYLDGSQTTTGDSYTFSTETSGTYTVRADVSDGTDTASKSWTVTITGSSFEEINENVEVTSILGEQTSSAVCGNGLAEDGENCLNCALDIKCGSGTICQGGVCVEKSSSKTLIIFLIILTVIISASIGGYYYFMLKKTPKPQQPQGFKYPPREVKPPADYTDFYKKK